MPDVVAHYKILRKIGSGGMGDVFLAEDANLHRQVALKVLRPETGTDPQCVKRFRREAYAASALTHPNIAVVYEAGLTEANALFIAMEYVAGEGLDERLAKGPLPADEIIDLAIEIADALDEAHSKGIVHRDLKPSNVIVSARGHAKVLDFGVARMATIPSSEIATTDVKSAPGTVVGTLPYSSPEQLLGRTVDHRSDIFSFGILLYEMATAERPFLGKSSTEVSEQICHGQPNAIARLNYEIPDQLERIIRKCMEKDPDYRYQSAREISADLKTLKRERSTGPRTAVPSASRKRRLVLQLAAAAVLLAAGIAAWVISGPRATNPTASPLDSVAVLPFANPNPNTEYLSDGITTSIIDTLSELPQVKVMSRTSVFRFKGRDIDPQEVGRRLKVRTIVSGRIQQVGDRLTVGAELIDVSDGHQLWGSQYNRQSADIFSLQEEIATKISEELRIELTGEQRQRLAKRYTNDPQAYALYLKGRSYSNKRTVVGLQRGIEFFQQAIARDPAYALAYVGLADSYAAYPHVAGISAAEWHARAKAAARKALQIDESVAEAHATLGLIEQAAWNREAAAREYRRAIELNPNDATAHARYSLNLCISGRRHEGLAEIRKAQELDPLSPLINLTLSTQQYVLGQDDEALKGYKSIIDLDPGFGWGYIYLGLLYAGRGECGPAVASLRKGVDLTERAPEAVGYLGYGLARCGDPQSAEKLSSELSRREASHVARALIAIGLGNRDEVFQELEAAYRDRDPQLIYLSWQREYSDIRSDSRYFDLVRRIGIPP